MYIEPVSQGASALRVTPAIAVATALTVAATLTVGIVPMFYEIIHVDTSNWLTLLLRQPLL